MITPDIEQLQSEIAKLQSQLVDAIYWRDHYRRELDDIKQSLRTNASGVCSSEIQNTSPLN